MYMYVRAYNSGGSGVISHLLRTRGGLHLVKRWSHVLQKWSIQKEAMLVKSLDVHMVLIR